jgi:transcriptional regulator with XRE-family HTH domain
LASDARGKTGITDACWDRQGLLRETRHAAQVTQVELAARIGETQSSFSKFERGERRLDVIQLRTICQALGTNLVTFVARFEERLARRKKKR